MDKVELRHASFSFPDFSDETLANDELLASGAAEFVQKPVTPTQLVAKVRALLDKRGSVK